MRQRPLLRVTIMYETPLDPELCTRVLAYFKPYEHVIHIDFNSIHSASKIILIPRKSWNPAYDTELSYFMRTLNQLYSVLITLIKLALKLLSEIGYHDKSDTLTIIVPSAPDENLSSRSTTYHSVKPIYQGFEYIYTITLYSASKYTPYRCGNIF